MLVLITVQLALVGLLAGEEFIVRWGIHPAISSLPDNAHVRALIALVQRLKVVVPLLIVPAVVASAAIVVVAGGSAGLAWRIGGAVGLIVFLLASFLGTVPINIGVNGWDPEQPPDTGVPETALWNLFQRASAALNGHLDDPYAVEVLNRLDYPFEHFESPHGALAARLHAQRVRTMDNALRKLLASASNSTVVALGEGFETQFWRVETVG